MVNSVLLKPPPFPDPDRIVMFMNTSPGQGGGGVARQIPALARADQRGAGRLGVPHRRGQLTGGDVPEQLQSAQVSAAFFRLFGAPIMRAALSAGGRPAERP